jgi:septum formation protein
MRLLLASQSETRKRMLEAAGVPFEAVPAEVDEDAAKPSLALAGFDARGTAEILAELKAKSLAAPDSIVLGCDQTLEHGDGAILSKPRSRAEALDQLRSLRGATHRLHAAAAAVENGEVAWRSCETVALTMRPLSDAFLQTYLDAEFEAVRFSVGCYRIEGRGAQLFNAIDGSYFAILGLPLLPLLAFLRARGVLAA